MDVLSGNLIESVTEQQRFFEALTSPDERKEKGHFGTPSIIAEFMAGLFTKIPRGTVRILDAGAGVGVLSAALCQRVLNENGSRHLSFELWENDPKLRPHLDRAMDRCRASLRDAGHRMDYAIRTDDFILANKRQSLFEDRSIASFHLAILNPPYYKLQKESVHARAMEHVVHGQPNIYALFMATAADLLLPHGEMVVITPRSYFNGLYFRRFRKWFFERMAARQIHVFGSRREAFEKDEVLQENVILLAEKTGKPGEVVLTTSTGRDLHDGCRRVVPYDKVIDPNDGDRVVRVITDDFESDIVEFVDSLPHRFRDRGYEISTGPVVSFRAAEFLRKERAEDTAPLFWMHNVRPFVTRFPPNSSKPAHMTVGDSSKRMLLPARRYILLKRFTAKEEKRRLVAGIMEAADSYSEWVGLENHLNYVYLKSGEWTRAEAFGLAAFFNSVLVDRYFRAISGNTQVNATEIRVMPVPDQPTLARIGEEVAGEKDRALCRVERIVGRALRLPGPLVEQLCKAAQ